MCSDDWRSGVVQTDSCGVFGNHARIVSGLQGDGVESGGVTGVEQVVEHGCSFVAARIGPYQNIIDEPFDCGDAPIITHLPTEYHVVPICAFQYRRGSNAYFGPRNVRDLD